MVLTLMFALWSLTLGIFVEGNVAYNAKESVSKEEFLDGRKHVFVSGFVTEHDRFTHGIPFVFAVNRPGPPYGMNIMTSVHFNHIQNNAKVILSSVRLVSDRDDSKELLGSGAIESGVIGHSLFDESVLGCNFVFDGALESHGTYRVVLAGSIEEIKFRESVVISSWNEYSFYPGWYKLLFLDHL